MECFYNQERMQNIFVCRSKIIVLFYRSPCSCSLFEIIFLNIRKTSPKVTSFMCDIHVTFTRHSLIVTSMLCYSFVSDIHACYVMCHTCVSPVLSHSFVSSMTCQLFCVIHCSHNLDHHDRIDVCLCCHDSLDRHLQISQVTIYFVLWSYDDVNDDVDDDDKNFKPTITILLWLGIVSK